MSDPIEEDDHEEEEEEEGEEEPEIEDGIGLYEEDEEDSSEILIEGMDPLTIEEDEDRFEEMVIEDEEERERDELLQDFEKGTVFERFQHGYRFEANSVYFFYENGLYRTVLLESWMFGGICLTLVIIEIVALIFFALFSVWEYFPVVGGGLQLPIILLFLTYLLLLPIFNDGYIRLSEKTERIERGETIDEKEVSFFNFRMDKERLQVHVISWIVSLIETFVIMTIILMGLACCFTIILLPIGIFILALLYASTTVFSGVRHAYIRHRNFKGFLELLFSRKYFPFLVGMGLCVIIKPKSVRLEIAKLGILSLYVGHSTTCSGARLYYILHREEEEEDSKKEQNEDGESEDSENDDSEEVTEVDPNQLPMSMLESPISSFCAHKEEIEEKKEPDDEEIKIVIRSDDDESDDEEESSDDNGSTEEEEESGIQRIGSKDLLDDIARPFSPIDSPEIGDDNNDDSSEDE